MEIIKTRAVKTPERNARENAGIDFFIPDNTPEFINDFLAKNPGVVGADAASSNDIEDTTLAYIRIAKKSILYKETGVIEIGPHKDVIIPSGIRSKFGPNLALIANNKSGIATKKKLIFGASVIDCSYQGEWHLHLINTSDEYQTIKCGDKIIQFIPTWISTEGIELKDETPEEFYTTRTSRGEGWQGSTNITEK